MDALETPIPATPKLPSRRQKQEWVRLQTVSRSEAGESVAQIAVDLGVSTRAVYQWLAAHQSGGHQALLGKKGVGRPPRLGLRETADLVRRLHQTPDQLGLPLGLWTADRVGKLIARLHHWRPSMPTIWKFMRQLGCFAQKPFQRTWQLNHSLIEHWRVERLPVIRGQAKVNRATILFAEASRIHSGAHGDAFEAAPDPIQATPAPSDMNLLSAMSVHGEMEFMLCNAPLDDRAWIRFLELLTMGRSTPVILVIDGQTIRDTEPLRRYAASTNGRLELEFLPAVGDDSKDSRESRPQGGSRAPAGRGPAGNRPQDGSRPNACP